MPDICVCVKYFYSTRLVSTTHTKSYEQEFKLKIFTFVCCQPYVAKAFIDYLVISTEYAYAACCSCQNISKKLQHGAATLLR